MVCGEKISDRLALVLVCRVRRVIFFIFFYENHSKNLVCEHTQYSLDRHRGGALRPPHGCSTARMSGDIEPS